MSDISIIKSLISKWTCREEEIQTLNRLFNKNTPESSCIHVFGRENTGKTGIIKDYLDSARIPHSYIDMSITVTERHILNQLFKDLLHFVSKDHIYVELVNNPYYLSHLNAPKADNSMTRMLDVFSELLIERTKDDKVRLHMEKSLDDFLGDQGNLLVNSNSIDEQNHQDDITSNSLHDHSLTYSSRNLGQNSDYSPVSKPIYTQSSNVNNSLVFSPPVCVSPTNFKIMPSTFSNFTQHTDSRNEPDYPCDDHDSQFRKYYALQQCLASQRNQVKEYQQILTSFNPQHHSHHSNFCVVLDNVFVHTSVSSAAPIERHAALFQALTRLSTVVGIPLTTIFISRRPWPSLSRLLGGTFPTIHFASYDTSSIVEIVTQLTYPSSPSPSSDCEDDHFDPPSLTVSFDARYVAHHIIQHIQSHLGEFDPTPSRRSSNSPDEDVVFGVPTHRLPIARLLSRAAYRNFVSFITSMLESVTRDVSQVLNAVKALLPMLIQTVLVHTSQQLYDAQILDRNLLLLNHQDQDVSSEDLDFTKSLYHLAPLILSRVCAAGLQTYTIPSVELSDGVLYSLRPSCQYVLRNIFKADLVIPNTPRYDALPKRVMTRVIRKYDLNSLNAPIANDIDSINTGKVVDSDLVPTQSDETETSTNESPSNDTVSDRDWVRLLKNNLVSNETDVVCTDARKRLLQSSQLSSLSIFGKLVLIASALAVFIPSKNDITVFGTNKNRRRRVVQRTELVKDSLNSWFQTPKPVPVERISRILRCIADSLADSRSKIRRLNAGVVDEILELKIGRGTVNTSVGMSGTYSCGFLGNPSDSTIGEHTLKLNTSIVLREADDVANSAIASFQASLMQDNYLFSRMKRAQRSTSTLQDTVKHNSMLGDYTIDEVSREIRRLVGMNLLLRHGSKAETISTWKVTLGVDISEVKALSVSIGFDFQAYFD